MLETLLFIVCALAYFGLATWFWPGRPGCCRTDWLPRLLPVMPLLLHLYLLNEGVFGGEGIRIGFATSISAVAALNVLIYAAASWRYHLAGVHGFVLAFAGLAVLAEAIARRFGVTTRHVEQRLALAVLSPKVKAAYRRDDLNLDAARAFCIEPDHSKQDAVLRALGKPITHAGQVRNLLMQGSMKATDRLVRFVGLEAYENAGGALSRDLFDPDTIFIADPGLITRLADTRLETVREELTGQGWGWAEINTGHGWMSGFSGQRIHASRRPMTRAERKALAKVDAEIEALDAKLNDSEDDDDAAWSRREDLNAERQALVDKTQAWDPELIALAGVVVSIDHEGRLCTTHGIVAKADQAKLKRLLAARAPEGAASSEDAPAAAAEDAGPKLSKAVARDLTAARAAALRLHLSGAPDTALALTVFALVGSRLQRHRPAGVCLAAEPVACADLKTFEHRRDALTLSLPGENDDLLAWCLAQDRETLLSALAVIIAETLDLAHEASSNIDHAKQSLADTLSTALDLDMRKYWSPDVAFLSRLSKPMLVDLLANAPSMTAKPVKRREAQLKTLAKLKRDGLAKAVAKTLKGAGWLPELLIAPVSAGALAITDHGETEAAIAAE